MHACKSAATAFGLDSRYTFTIHAVVVSCPTLLRQMSLVVRLEPIRHGMRVNKTHDCERRTVLLRGKEVTRLREAVQLQLQRAMDRSIGP